MATFPWPTKADGAVYPSSREAAMRELAVLKKGKGRAVPRE